jgi:histidine phosphotransferase ChpT
MVETIPVPLVELLCSRLLHDLTSPIAAVNNGVELIREIGIRPNEGGDEALEMIETAALQSVRRVQALRLAWGSAGGDASLHDARSLALPLFQAGRIQLHWPEFTVPPALAEQRGTAKLVLNAVLLAADALPGQGRVSVAASPEGEAILVRAEGRQPRLKGSGAAAIDGRLSDDEIEPQGIVASWAVRLARSYGLKLSVEEAEDTATLRIAAG